MTTADILIIIILSLSFVSLIDYVHDKDIGCDYLDNDNFNGGR